MPAHGKPHADAGARGFNLPRLNDGKFAVNGDDPANNTWFDTKGNSRVLVDLGRNTSAARINVYSWHSGALSPQRFTLWASDAESAPPADPSDLSKSWREVAIAASNSFVNRDAYSSSFRCTVIERTTGPTLSSEA